MITGGQAIILVEPQLGENIELAATCRWQIWGCPETWHCQIHGWPGPAEKAKKCSAKADQMSSTTQQIFDTVEEALSGLNLVYATTARLRHVRVSQRPEAAMKNARKTQ